MWTIFKAFNGIYNMASVLRFGWLWGMWDLYLPDRGRSPQALEDEVVTTGPQGCLSALF